MKNKIVAPSIQGAGAELSDARRILAVVLLAIALVSEGFDLQAANFGAPDIVRDFGVSRASMGPLLSANQVGMLFGASLLGSLGDRFGRKTVIVCATATYGVLSLIAAFSGSFWGLTILRFLIGLCLGAVVPNAMVMATEFASEPLKVKAAALVTVGISLGSASSGLVAAMVMPIHGWRGLFLAGGIAPLVIATLLVLALPESPVFDRLRSTDQMKRGATVSPRELFSGPFKVITPLIWGVFALLQMTLVLLSAWTPMLLGASGHSIREAALVSSVYHLGGVAGAAIAGIVVVRKGWSTLTAFLGATAISLVVLSFGADSTLLVALGLAAAGFFVVGAQTTFNGACSVVYPSNINATGVGWTLGVGRLGSITGPLLGSAAVTYGMTSSRGLFLLALCPVCLVTIGAAILARRTRGLSPLNADGRSVFPVETKLEAPH